MRIPPQERITFSSARVQCARAAVIACVLPGVNARQLKRSKLFRIKRESRVFPRGIRSQVIDIVNSSADLVAVLIVQREGDTHIGQLLAGRIFDRAIDALTAVIRAAFRGFGGGLQFVIAELGDRISDFRACVSTVPAVLAGLSLSPLPPAIAAITMIAHRASRTIPTIFLALLGYFLPHCGQTFALSSISVMQNLHFFIDILPLIFLAVSGGLRQFYHFMVGMSILSLIYDIVLIHHLWLGACVFPVPVRFARYSFPALANLQALFRRVL